MFQTTFIYKKTIRTTTPDGKTVEEVVEQSSGPEAQAKMDEASAEMDKHFQKMGRFFGKMSEAFKELW